MGKIYDKHHGMTMPRMFHLIEKVDKANKRNEENKNSRFREVIYKGIKSFKNQLCGNPVQGIWPVTEYSRDYWEAVEKRRAERLAK